MSRVLYIDCFAGAAGDMFVGALLDLGVPIEVVRAEVDKLGVGVSLRIAREARHAIEGVRVHVDLRGEEIVEWGALTPTPHDHGRHGHVRVHDHGGGHAHDHDHGDDHDHDDDHEHGRSYREIDALLARAGLSKGTEQLARRAFRLLAEAEARVHGVAVADVAFHEVGAADALADIVGACAAVAHLAPEEIVASPVPLGRGIVRGAHGMIPVPSPATVEILRGAPVYGLADEGETVTPTGAALLAAFAHRYGPLPPMRIERTGYGAGARNPRARPNLLRLVLGADDAASPFAFERLSVLEANIDDMNPELFEHLFERLFAAGARDVWLTPVQMKKGRPATVLSVLCDLGASDALAELVVRESTSIGVRRTSVDRFAVPRELVEVETPWGKVRVKVARTGTALVNVAPEYEDCRKVAQAAGVPLKRVYQEALRAFGEGPSS